jgi:uncharacterized membrane protein
MVHTIPRIATGCNAKNPSSADYIYCTWGRKVNQQIISILEKLSLIVIGILLFYTTLVGLYTIYTPEDSPHYLQIGLTALTLTMLYVGLQIQKLADKMGTEKADSTQE